MDLLDFLRDHLPLVGEHSQQNGHVADLITFTSELSPMQRVTACLEALCNVLAANTGIFAGCSDNRLWLSSGLEILLIGHFRLIFSYLRVERSNEVRLKALRVRYRK